MGNLRCSSRGMPVSVRGRIYMVAICIKDGISSILVNVAATGIANSRPSSYRAPCVCMPRLDFIS